MSRKSFEAVARATTSTKAVARGEAGNGLPLLHFASLDTRPELSMTPLGPEIHPFKPDRTIAHEQAEILALVCGLGLTMREVGFVLMKAAREKNEHETSKYFKNHYHFL